MTKLLFLDLDGVRQSASGETFIQSPQDQAIILGADRALKHFHQLGYTCIGITNQDGVAYGYKSLPNCIHEQHYTLTLFPELDRIFFCPDLEGQKLWEVGRNYTHNRLPMDNSFDSFRKPGAGMLQFALQDFDTNPQACWMVGTEEDRLAAVAANIHFCPADHWRSRFLPGIHLYLNATPDQLRFLESTLSC